MPQEPWHGQRKLYLEYRGHTEFNFSSTPRDNPTVGQLSPDEAGSPKVYHQVLMKQN